MSEWIAPGVLLTLVGLVVAALKFGFIEIPSARADAEATRVDTADQLLGMVRAELERQEARTKRQNDKIRHLEQLFLEHRAWDLSVREELRRLDPDAYARVGPPPSLTFD